MRAPLGSEDSPYLAFRFGDSWCSGLVASCTAGLNFEGFMGADDPCLQALKGCMPPSCFDWKITADVDHLIWKSKQVLLPRGILHLRGALEVRVEEAAPGIGS